MFGKSLELTVFLMILIRLRISSLSTYDEPASAVFNIKAGFFDLFLNVS